MQSEKLKVFLTESGQNFAVLTDYAAMEAYKDDTLTSIYRSMEIVSLFPKQVIVLKDTRKVCGLSGRGAGLQRRMIDHAQTRQFSQYCLRLKHAKGDDISFQERLLRLGRDATSQMNAILKNANTFSDAIEKIACTYNGREIGIIRKAELFTVAMVDKLAKNILQTSAFLFRDHPSVNKLPSSRDLPNTFIFRSALCAHLLAIEWISVGGAQKAKAEKIRNDIVDTSFAAYATFLMD